MNKKIIMETDSGTIVGDVYNVEYELGNLCTPKYTVEFFERPAQKKAANCAANIKTYDMSNTVRNAGLTARKVIFNPPATIVLWEDGKRTVVKCDKDDEYDEMKGLALCYMKKALGNTSRELNKALRKGRSYGRALQTD